MEGGHQGGDELEEIGKGGGEGVGKQETDLVAVLDTFHHGEATILATADERHHLHLRDSNNNRLGWAWPAATLKY